MPHQQAMAKTPQKLHIKTFGCPMNAYDSERMAEALADHGYAATDDPVEADLVILNTCHIREKAAEKVYSELGRVRALKRAPSRPTCARLHGRPEALRRRCRRGFGAAALSGP